MKPELSRSEPTQIRTHESIRDIGEERWSALAGDDAPPFLRFGWFDALEQTGCVGERSGWLPFYLTFEQQGTTVAAMPAFVKTNSEGEFVFDHAWARFCESRLGRPYYPKLVVGVPFTPATAPRLLLAAGLSLSTAAGLLRLGLERIVDQLGLSSAHVLFPTEAEAEQLAGSGMVLRYGLQFHWQNANYATFDDFLSCFSSKRRHQIRREQRELAQQGIELEALSGAALTPEYVDFVYRFYRSTVDKFYWGRRYLNRSFFEQICARLGDGLHVVVARPGRGRAPIAGAFNLVGPKALYGRYWGAIEERPFLHFNVCYYAGIQHCIERGLALFEPGAGGEHKLARGFMPTVTFSAHHLADGTFHATIDDFCRRERQAVLEHVSEARKNPVLRPR